MGSCVIVYQDERFLLYIVAWRGVSGLRAYIDFNESMHIMRLLGVDLTTFGKLLLFISSIHYCVNDWK